MDGLLDDPVELLIECVDAPADPIKVAVQVCGCVLHAAKALGTFSSGLVDSVNPRFKFRNALPDFARNPTVFISEHAENKVKQSENTFNQKITMLRHLAFESFDHFRVFADALRP